MQLSRLGTVLRNEGPKGIWDRLVRRNRRYSARMARKMGRSVVPSVYGLRFAANWNDLTFQFYVDASYGFFLFNRLKRREGSFVFLDIGANQGLYTIVAAQNPNCKGAWAFEPVPATRDLLERNIGLNGVGGAAHVVPSAVTSSDGSLTIMVPKGHSGMARLDVQGDGETQYIPLEINGMSRVGLDALQFGADEDIVVKIDVEGHEETVLRELLASRHAARISEIFYECDETWLDAENLMAMLRAAGFSRIRKIGSGVHYDVLAER